jgi:hypothetical protein
MCPHRSFADECGKNEELVDYEQEVGADCGLRREKKAL